MIRSSLSSRYEHTLEQTMKHPTIIRSALIACALVFCGASGTATAAPPSFAHDRILVKANDHMNEVAVHALLASHGAEESGRVPQIGVRIVKVPADRLERVLAALNRNPNIEFAEKDPIAQAVLTPNDPQYGNQWHLPKIKSPQAWDITTGARDTVIAILDTGIAYNHPDLKGKILQGYNFIGGNTNAADDQGHGTLVSGAAAALSNNGIGVAGVAWNNLILPVKVLDSKGSGSHSTIANGITYAADNGARIINLSLGSTSGSRTLERAVNYAWNRNSILVAAAGNNGNSTLFYPAAYANVIGVSALNSSDTLPSWSSFGSHVSVSAPGVSILTTTVSGSYGYASGTSLASPLVAGVAALVAGSTPQLTNAEVRSIVESTATDLGAAGYDIYYGHGRVDAHAAVVAAAGSIVDDITAPLVRISSPAPGATVSGTVDVLVDATDDVGVTRIELYVDGSLLASSASASVAFAWNTTTAADGVRVLEARAYDAAGNVGSSGNVSVTVANASGGTVDATPPQVAITSPADGATVSRNVKIDVVASDDVGVVLIELFINGRRVGTSTSSTASFSWNTNREPRGEHLLQAYAHDAAGNVSTTSIKVYKR